MHLDEESSEELKVRREQVPLRPIFEGKFPKKEEIPVTAEDI
ncbi:MAG: hypothetical protein WA364_20245 [Candidatus Nitrosopolaris sp.]